MNLQEKIEELEKQLKELKEEVNKLEEFPKKGYDYYWIDAFGDVEIDTWNGGSGDYCCLAIGNVFKTEEDAKFMMERLKVLAELRKLSRPYIFDDNHDNYTICYDHCISKITIYMACEDQLNIYFFDTPEETKAAIEKIGEDRLKKYYFMVGDED